MRQSKMVALLAVVVALPGCHKEETGDENGRPEKSTLVPLHREPLTMDLAAATSRPERAHNQLVSVEGIVTSVCKEEGCFIDIVPLSGKGHGVLVSARHGAFKFPEDSVGQVAAVRGTFYSKVYPFSRMDHWHHHGWRAREGTIPRFARIFRIEADSVTFRRQEQRTVEEIPLVPYTSPVVDLNAMAFEAARMGTGRTCLAAGEKTPERSTRRYHELLFAVEGELEIRTGTGAKTVRLSPGHALYVPPQTMHVVSNKGPRRACYNFVYSLPETHQH